MATLVKLSQKIQFLCCFCSLCVKMIYDVVLQKMYTESGGMFSYPFAKIRTITKQDRADEMKEQGLGLVGLGGGNLFFWHIFK